MAWHIERSLTCPTCNTRYEEWDQSKGGDVHAYYGRAINCIGCQTRGEARAAAEINESSGLKMHGLQVNLVRNPDAPPIPSILSGRWLTKL